MPLPGGCLHVGRIFRDNNGSTKIILKAMHAKKREKIL